MGNVPAEVSELQAMQRALREAQENLRSVIDGFPEAILVSREGLVTYANRAAVELLGCGWEMLVGRAIEEILPRPTSTREPHAPLRVVSADGRLVDVEWITVPALFDGAPSSLSLLRDVSDRRRAEDTRRRLAAIVETADYGIVGLTLSGRVEDWNRGAERIFGYTAAEMLGRHVGVLAPEDQREEIDRLTQAVAAGEHVYEHETARVRKDGARIEVVITLSPVRNAAGRVVAISAVIRDTTELRRMRAQLLLADRMVSIGTLAAGVAHEINNPLSYVTANLAVIEEEVDKVDGAMRRAGVTADLAALKEALHDARVGAERVRVIVRDLKTFSRPDEESEAEVDLERVIRSTLNMARNEIRHRARLVTDLGPAPRVRGNDARLGQVFLNLLINAAQAIPEGDPDVHEIAVALRQSEGGGAEVEVRDTGAGIPPEIHDRLFDPFFTTKPVGTGTGLGLSICHGIVTALGGSIRFDSEVGKGSTFRVVLPPARLAAACAAPGATATAVSAARRGRILVIDDEPLVGRTVQRAVRREHDVVVETDAAAALARIARGEPYDVILCDLMMPEMTGMELHEELLRIDPDAARRVVFVTGGPFTTAAHEYLARTSVPRVEKPFDRGALLELLRERVG